MSDNINKISEHMEGINLEDYLSKARVVTHSTTTMSQGIKDWKKILAGKLFAPGIMLWQNAENAAKYIWHHLKRDNQWQIMVRSLQPNIFGIRFCSIEDKDVILFGGAWNFDGYLIVLKDWHPSYQKLNFNTSPFWLEYKYLLPEFTCPEMLSLFGNVVGETVVVEPDGVHPTTSNKFRALVMVNVTTHLIKGTHVANAAGVARWVGFFFEKQPYKLSDECKVPDHDTRLVQIVKLGKLIWKEL